MCRCSEVRASAHYMHIEPARKEVRDGWGAGHRAGQGSEPGRADEQVISQTQRSQATVRGHTAWQRLAGVKSKASVVREDFPRLWNCF